MPEWLAIHFNSHVKSMRNSILYKHTNNRIYSIKFLAKGNPCKLSIGIFLFNFSNCYSSTDYPQLFRWKLSTMQPAVLCNYPIKLQRVTCIVRNTCTSTSLIIIPCPLPIPLISDYLNSIHQYINGRYSDIHSDVTPCMQGSPAGPIFITS